MESAGQSRENKYQMGVFTQPGHLGDSENSNLSVSFLNRGDSEKRIAGGGKRHGTDIHIRFINVIIAREIRCR